MSDAIKNVVLLLLSAIVGFGFGFLFAENFFSPITDEIKIGVSVVVTLAAFASLYFISKGGS